MNAVVAPPERWRDLTLADVAQWSSGGTPKAGTTEYYGGDIPWAVIGDLNDGVVTSTASTITEAGLSNSSAKVVPTGTLLVAMYGSIGKLGIAGSSMATNQAIACAVPNPDIDARYLFHYLKSQREDLLRAGKGGAQQNISQTVLRAWPISVPPLGEQRRLALLLDDIDVRRGSIADRLAAAHAIVDRLRAAVLAAACSGRLTADWREQHRDAVSEDGSRLAQPSESVLDVPKSWAQTKLEDVATRITSGPRDWTPYYGRGTSTFVMAQNVRPGKLDWSFRQAVEPPPDDPSRRRCQIEVGDLLVTIVGANTGDAAPVLHARAEHFVCQSVALVRLANADCATYLSHWFTSAAHGRRYFEECMYGAGRPHLSFEQLRRAPIATPPIAEQREINRRIAAAYGALDRLEASIASAEDSLADAWRAGLAEAFRDDLVVSQGPRLRHDNHLADRAVSTSDGAPTR